MPSRLNSSPMWGTGFCHSTCLKPTYSLRRQVLFSFGMTGIITTACVVVMACICAISAGHVVQELARSFMGQEVIHSISNSSQYAAQTFSQEVDHLRGTVSLIGEIVRDRIANYPLEGWEDDSRVPFASASPDIKRRYPLKSPLLPRDWNVTINVNGTNHHEHLHELFDSMMEQHDPDMTRHHHHHIEPKFSTCHAAYAFQGNCDPSVEDPDDPTYYEGCTEEHNNGTSGGIRPTSTSAGLEAKAADIGTLLKPIWESRPDLLQVSVHFVNEGAGSMVHFPSFVHKNDANAYQSIGCDWLVENMNPYTKRPFLTKDQADRNCHAAGEWVQRRDSNPLEQEWFRDQVLHPDDTRFFGPIIDGFVTPGGLAVETSDGHDVFFWILRVGRAIYDRYSGELIGSVSTEVLLHRWSTVIRDTVGIQNYSNAILIRQDGTVLAGGSLDLYNSKETTHATEVTSVVHDVDFFQDLMDDLANRKELKARRQEEKGGWMSEVDTATTTAVAECATGRVLSASSIPGSEFVYIQAVSEEMLGVIDDIKQTIHQDVIYSSVSALVIGVLGMAILMIVVYTVSMVLTRPLNWIRDVAYSIVNHTTSGLQRKSLRLEDFDEESAELDAENCVSSALKNPASHKVKCTPDTEITELVQEFKQMIRGFSGADKASTVAKPNGHEIRNTLAWQSSFQELYSKGKAPAEELPITLRHGLNGIGNEADLNLAETSESGHDDPNASDDLFRCAKRDYATPTKTLPAKDSGAPQPPNFSREASGTTATSTLVPPSVVTKDEWRNQGRNLRPPPFSRKLEDDQRFPCVPYESPLYRWILVLIVIPMIVTNVVILATVSERIASVLPQWLENVESASLDIQLDDLRVASKFSSLYAEAVLETPVRDLFVTTRLAEWLFTDAIQRDTEAALDMSTGAEACKAYPQNCPWFDDPFLNAPCDCSWENRRSFGDDMDGPNCFDIEDDTRHMQTLFYAGQEHDAHPVTGVRSSTSYPLLDMNAANTSWWDNQALVPGADKGKSASGYETTYDRLRVFSAMSVVLFPLYNYRSSLVTHSNHKFLGAYIGFESDGMLAGWAGCRYPSPQYPHFHSDESNLAFRINGTLCPYGKFGYDARCRDWYATGKTISQGPANITSMHITPPYELAAKKLVASSVTQSLTDPRTNEYIGQSVVDFQQFEMLNFGLMRREGCLHFMITPSSDKLGGDTVVPPNPGHHKGTGTAFHVEAGAAAIGDLVLPYDERDSLNRQQFDEIVRMMKNGSSGLHLFNRTAQTVSEDGNHTVVTFHDETIWLAYDPVRIRALDSIRSDDFARGLNVSELLVYSLGVGRTLEELQSPFNQFMREARCKLQIIVGVYIGLTILISLTAASVACRISVGVTRPMVTLLTVVRNINSGKINDDIPPLYGGSREVNQVYTSFAKLFKIVRVSNNAFFMRNLNWSCHFVRDALKLFTKIDDRKAIAIASGNLGSTLLAISCERPAEKRCTCLKLGSECCSVKEAFFHFDKAVKSGTCDFENAKTMDQKVEFAQQLSDRHFNRALYFLLSADDPCAENFEELGLEDLLKTQALDLDVQEYWIENGFLMQKASILFDRLLRRLHGLCALLENGVSQDIWDPKAVAYDIHRILSAVWDDDGDALFDDHSPIGRLQQLEGALIHLQLHQNQVEDAARIAMRMLVDDEFLNEAAFQNAAEAFLKHSAADAELSILSKASAQRDIRRMLKSCKQASAQAKRCIFYSLELSEEGNLESIDLEHHLLTLYDTQCGQDDFFGLMASNSNSPSRNNLVEIRMGCKNENQGEQRRQIELAIEALGESTQTQKISSLSSMEMRTITALARAAANPMSSMSGRDVLTRLGKTPKTCKALSAALEKLIASEVSAAYDSYIVYVTDGPKRNWDWKALALLKSRIEETNAKRKADIHLVIIDLEYTPRTGSDEADACAKLCQVSKGSAYINASLTSLEEDFEKARACLSAGNKSSTQCSGALLSGLTMEKF